MKRHLNKDITFVIYFISLNLLAGNRWGSHWMIIELFILALSIYASYRK